MDGNPKTGITALDMEQFSFIGTHDMAIDEKNRIVLPSPFRKDNSDDLLASNFFVIPHSHGYLIIRPQPNWQSYIASIHNDPELSAVEKRKFVQALYNNSVKVKPDSQYRLVLSQKFRDVLRFEDDSPRQALKITGCGEHFEIWPPELFKGEGKSIAELSLFIDKFEGM